ncbi:DUF2249 domain-containing protein [Micromonospora sp. BRA006-A]|nr:DUF2249 domain-containing protein [Micromonospora sp. BRA006-A]
MLDEHQAITGLVAELETGNRPVRLAGTARPRRALRRPPGQGERPGRPAAGGRGRRLAGEVAGGDARSARLLGKLEWRRLRRGGCGCGGDRAPADAPAPTLTIDPRLDVRQLPHDQRHARVLAALEALPAGGALVLVAPRTPPAAGRGRSPLRRRHDQRVAAGRAGRVADPALPPAGDGLSGLSVPGRWGSGPAVPAYRAVRPC